jgi:Holliday junction resolvase RusA-like endonuclease
MKFILDGEPIPQARHRTVNVKGKNRNYDPLAGHKTVDRLHLAQHAMNNPYIAYKDYYHVNFVFYFKVPNSDSKKVRALKLENALTHSVKPDVDNCIKYLLDCMNGVFFSDDKKVVKIQSEKRWAQTGYVEIEINGFNHEIADG